MTIHVFTIIQLVCVVVLTIVAFTSVAILLPLLLTLLVPLRMAMARFIDPEHLVLDADEVGHHDDRCR